MIQKRRCSFDNFLSVGVTAEITVPERKRKLAKRMFNQTINQLVIVSDPFGSTIFDIGQHPGILCAGLHLFTHRFGWLRNTPSFAKTAT